MVSDTFHMFPVIDNSNALWGLLKTGLFIIRIVAEIAILDMGLMVIIGHIMAEIAILDMGLMVIIGHIMAEIAILNMGLMVIIEHIMAEIAILNMGLMVIGQDRELMVIDPVMDIMHIFIMGCHFFSSVRDMDSTISIDYSDALFYKI